MTLILKINTDNAAFADDLGAEVARILRHAAEKAEYRIAQMAKDGYKLFDINGNCVGALYVEEPDS